ncbi:MAG: amidophosphoribosyltransferase [Lachnospiraceae bacterium]|nr:amidophosphoribosyltransferase [Lachnospiraceae bacterium]
MAIQEACGVFGLYSPEKVNAAKMTYYGLISLQHRGQESAGIVVNDDGLFFSHKDMGLVNEIFTEEVFRKLPEAEMAVGHVRYGTTGGNTRNNIQPMEVNHQKGKLAIAHNGNLTNAWELRNSLELSGAIFHSTSDTETIAYMITRARLKTGTIEEAVNLAMDEIEGAYSLVLMSATKLIAVRDPYGFRPLCYGKTEDGVYVVASESCALHAVGAAFIRDIDPGEIVIFSSDGVTSDRKHCGKHMQKTCIFEYIYFARPDSEIDGISVHASRIMAGRLLAKESPVDADLVIGVPDSGLDAALGFSLESGIPYGIGLVKNKYIGRTFIAPAQEERVDMVRMKLHPVGHSLRGKRIVLLDDSIVRGTTSRSIISLIREAGATEIHLRICAPPFIHPCYYGTDIDSEEHLIAAHHSVSQIAQMIGADSLEYLNPASLPQLLSGHEKRFCSACFDGSYPTGVPKETRKDRFEQRLSKREC